MRLSVSIKKILDNVCYELIYGNVKGYISDVVCSSKLVTKNACFVAIKGYNSDGHKYVCDAFYKGARLFILERKNKELILKLEGLAKNNIKDITILLVDDTRKAYALLCRNYYGCPDRSFIMIGITGTKGKTTTSFFLKALLETKYRVGLIGTVGSYIEGEYVPTKNTTPDAKEIFSLLYTMKKRGITHVVMEVSSQGLMLHRVEGIRFCLGLFTNFSIDHIGTIEHHSLGEYFYQKCTLCAHCRKYLVNEDDGYSVESGNESKNLYGYSLKNEKILAQFSIKWENIKRDCNFGAYLYIEDKGTKQSACHYIPGAFTFVRENIIAALSAANILGIDILSDLAVVAKVNIPGRMQMIYASKKLRVLVDYAHNENSLKRVLLSLRNYHPKRIICVFGCGGERSKYRREAMGRISSLYADLTIITEDNSRLEDRTEIFSDILKGFANSSANFLVIPDRKNAIIYALKNSEDGDVILLAGKGHEKYLIANNKAYYFSEEAIVREYFSE